MNENMKTAFADFISRNTQGEQCQHYNYGPISSRHR